MSLNCSRCDRIIASLVTKYSCLSDIVLGALLSHCLRQSTSTSIATAVLIMSQRPRALVSRLEDWFINRFDGMFGKKLAERNGANFLEDVVEWNMFVPLLFRYVLTASKKGNFLYVPVFIQRHLWAFRVVYVILFIFRLMLRMITTQF